MHVTDERGSVAGRLRRAVGTLRGRPWLWLVGATWAAVALAGVFAVTAAWNVAGGLVFDLLADPAGRRYRFPVDGPTVRHALPRAGLTLALALPAYLFARATVLVPGTALADRTVRGTAFGGAARGVLADWPDLARSAVSRGLLHVAVWLPVALLAVAVYLSVGTALEAVGYALGLYSAVPGLLTTVALAAAAASIAWAVAAATLREYDAAERPGPVGLSTAFAVTVAHPRRRLVDALVTTGLAALPFAVGAGLVVLSLSADVERTTTLWVTVVLFALLATVTLSTAAAYRSLSVVDADPRRRHAAGRSDDRRPDRSDASAPTGRVFLAVVLVVSAGLVGAGVRFADVHPGTGAAAAPGPVPDDPDGAIERGVAALAETSWTADERWYDRRVYPENDTVEPWRQRATIRVAVDRRDRQLLVFGVVNGTNDPTGPGTLVYVSRTGARVGDDVARVDTPDVNRTVRETFSRTTGAAALPTRFDSVVGGVDDGPTDAGSGWRVVSRGDGEVVYESTAPETVVGFNELMSASVYDGEEVDPVSVRVTLDATTGHLQRVETVSRYLDPDDPGVEQRRHVRTYSDVGSTDVTVPADPGRPPSAVVLDALLY